jgi:hypothetical protein
MGLRLRPQAKSVLSSPQLIELVPFSGDRDDG